MRGLGFSTVLVICICATSGSAPAKPDHDDDGGPVASFTSTPALPAPDQAVTFTSSSPGAKYLLWDLDGDGRFDDGTGSTATYSFSAVGSHTVRLLAIGGDGRFSIATRTVVVDQPPSSSFDVSTTAPLPGQVVTLTSTASDSDGSIAWQSWDLNGDGIYGDATGPSATVAAPASGSFAVGLRVTDDQGATATFSRTIDVQPAPVVTAAPAEQAPASFDLSTPSAGSGSTPPPVAGGLRRLSPFPVVRIRGVAMRSTTRVRLFSVAAPAGARIEVRCMGRHCPARRIVRFAGSGGLLAPVRVHRLERRLAPGTLVDVLVGEPGFVGKYTSFRFRRGKPPRRSDGCVLPGTSGPDSCPAT